MHPASYTRDLVCRSFTDRNVTVIKSNLEDYLETAPDTLETPAEAAETQEVNEQKEEAGQKVVDRIVISSPITGVAAELSTAPDEPLPRR